MTIRGRLHTVQLVGMMASGLVLAATVVVGGLLTPGYSQLADTASELGSHGQPHAWLARAGFIAYGALVIACAPALHSPAAGRSRVVAGLIAGYGGAAIVAGIAPKDPRGPVHTTASQVHVAATLVGGTMLFTAMVLVALRSQDPWVRARAWIAAGLSVAGSIAFRFLWGTGIYGLVERGLLAVAALWLGSLAGDELRATHRADARPPS